MVEDSLVRMRLMVLFVMMTFCVVVWLPLNGEAEVPNEAYLRVHFFDVGQGDSILIETPDGIQVLIDGGPDAGVLRELSKVMRFSDRTIDMMVGTHPDKDHVGGLVDVLERYEVKTILTTDNQGKSESAKLYEKLILAEGAEVVNAKRGQRFQLGASTTLEVLWPETDTEEMESNVSSIVLKLTYGEVSFLLTGDAPKRVEEYLVLAYGEHLNADVLKVGHHGSRTSTSELFLSEVSPSLAVLSYDEGNSYGHPHVEVTDTLFNARVETLSTAEEGSVTFYSDGQEVW